MRILRNIGRGLAVLLVPFTVFVIVASVGARSVVPALANPDNIRAGLATSEVYAEVVPEILPVLLSGNAGVDPEFPLNFAEVRGSMQEDDWRAFANELVPPEWIQIQAESILDALITYLDGAPAIIYSLDVDT
ncbi:MAG: hypothetical protein AAF125_26360, partial [Chloroflexota bacterium]